MSEILGIVIIGLFVFSVFLYLQYRKKIKANDELKSRLSRSDIELATHKERVAYLDDTLQKIEDLEERIKEKQLELLNTKEDSSSYKASLDEQKDKYSEFLIASDTRISELKADKKELQIQVNQDRATVSQLQTKLEEQNKAMKEKVQLLQNSEAKLKTEFENLASKIFDSNSKKFAQQNQESLGHILNPMQQQLTDFKKRVEDVYDKEAKDRSALQGELKLLKELNQKMTTETTNLTKALKGDSKKQGKWGEVVLENVLESSGLREGYEYNKEISLRDDEDRLFRPDVIVNLPDSRHIIIDAKTSLTAYSEYIASDDEADRQVHVKSHIRSMKEHIKGLSSKKYEDLPKINSLDFIFMFVPIESALLLAMESDITLYDEAFKQKIILVSPTTLLVALRAVENTWRYERQAQSIEEVYKRAEELYKKFNGFVEDLKRVGKGLESANDSYNEAFKKLSTGGGNLVRQATLLKEVSNIKPKKEIDSVLVDGAKMDVLNDKI